LERKKSLKMRGSVTENTAGFGSVGPNSGTPSLAVTATLWYVHEYNSMVERWFSL
jgi:hypothetical protein